MLFLTSVLLAGGGLGREQHEAKTNSRLSNDVDIGVNTLMRRKRSLGLFASMVNRVMFHMVQDSMEPDENNVVDDEDVVKLVKCDLVLERKVCTIKQSESVCQNYYGKQCFMYKYPRTTTTVEKRE